MPEVDPKQLTPLPNKALIVVSCIKTIGFVVIAIEVLGRHITLYITVHFSVKCHQATATFRANITHRYESTKRILKSAGNEGKADATDVKL